MEHAIRFCTSVADELDLSREREIHALATPGASIHEVGTARMGSDAESSFLNGFNQSWEIPNLFVTDGAAFPASPYPNPTLTMAALTLRACDVIAAELSRDARMLPLGAPRETINAKASGEERAAPT
jgi:choline dehydrogenase-like flavoprotein